MAAAASPSSSGHIVHDGTIDDEQIRSHDGATFALEVLDT
jgi:hypothetical protein